MTAFIPNVRVDVLRGVDTDAWGDETDTSTVIAARVPACITEQSQRSFLPAESRGGVVQTYTVRLRPGTDVQEGDRLATLGGTVYTVDEVSSPASIVGLVDVRTVCRRASAHS